jgi:hypothetical protein
LVVWAHDVAGARTMAEHHLARGVSCIKVKTGIDPASDIQRVRAVRDVVASWRAEAERLSSLPSEASEKAFRRLGLVRREEAEDLTLRVAQLEHRVRLLEKPSPGSRLPRSTL